MNIDLLNFLETMSPWWWVALAFALGAVEMLTGTFVLIWVALAALLSALLLALKPAVSGELQVVIFAALSVILTLAGRSLLARFGDGGEANSTLNQRSGHLVGRNAKVIDFANGQGTVKIEGMQWRAHWPAGEENAPGDVVCVTQADGLNLIVTGKRP